MPKVIIPFIISLSSVIVNYSTWDLLIWCGAHGSIRWIIQGLGRFLADRWGSTFTLSSKRLSLLWQKALQRKIERA